MSPAALADWLGTAPAPDPAGDPTHVAPQPQPIG
jgi:hypothetical protein